VRIRASRSWCSTALRYWVQEMHVDGFRFDLAPVLGRGDGFDRHAALLQGAAPGPGAGRRAPDRRALGHRARRLPARPLPRGWLEWNDKFRDTRARGFWLGGGVHARASSRAASPGPAPTCSSTACARPPGASTSSPRTTASRWRDLVTYDLRHNHANGEDNRDGHATTSWNCGDRRGRPTMPAVLQRAPRLQRAMLATLLLAQGTPMLAAGDEFGTASSGNNNAYCQDNPTTWLDWAQADRDLIAFVARCWRCAATGRCCAIRSLVGAWP
jgi:glycogen operon protein